MKLTFLLCITVKFLIAWDDSIPLNELDRRILEAMKHPEKVKDQGFQMLKYTYFYFCMLDDIFSRLGMNEPKGYELYKEVKDFGGPHFVNYKYDIDAFWYYWRWNHSDYNELKACIIGTRKSVRKIERRINKTEPPRDYSFIYDSRKYESDYE